MQRANSSSNNTAQETDPVGSNKPKDEITFKQVNKSHPGNTESTEYMSNRQLAYAFVSVVLAAFVFVTVLWVAEFGIWIFSEMAQSQGYWSVIPINNTFTNTTIRFVTLLGVIGGFVVTIAVMVFVFCAMNCIMAMVIYNKQGQPMIIGTTTEESKTNWGICVAAIVFIGLGFASILLDSILHGIYYGSTTGGYTPTEKSFSLWCCIICAVGSFFALLALIFSALALYRCSHLTLPDNTSAVKYGNSMSFHTSNREIARAKKNSRNGKNH